MSGTNQKIASATKVACFREHNCKIFLDFQTILIRTRELLELTEMGMPADQVVSLIKDVIPTRKNM